ncbi:nuclear transport factor 2 family protein [Halioglobus maricola]|nr:nuclear transport factor 2 family protein [Halioglobus maricola]
MPESPVTVEERAAAIDLYNAYAEGVDTKNWGMVRSCFADTVYIDYATGVHDRDPSDPWPADEWVEGIKAVINGFDLTRHIISNHRFRRDGDTVVCQAYLTADHIIWENGVPEAPNAGPDELSRVVGEYTNRCALLDGRWRIVASKLVVAYSTGPDELFVTAMQRAAAIVE